MLKKLILIGLGVWLVYILSTGGPGPGPVGRQLPELNLRFLTPRPAIEGRAVLLEFWATWCGPCRQVIPHLNGITEKYRPHGLVVIGVSNEAGETVRSFMASSGQKYTIALDPSGPLFREFGIRGIPHAVLADKSGRVVWRGHPSALTDEVIASAIR